MTFLVIVTIAAGMLAAYLLGRGEKVTGVAVFMAMIYLSLRISVATYEPNITCPENTAPYYYDGKSYCINAVEVK
jgi:hypothetical protein